GAQPHGGSFGSSSAGTAGGMGVGLESTFQSEEGFGEPDPARNGREQWTVRHVLSYMKARPGMYLTHIIMEYCDRGSLLCAIKRGVFRTDNVPPPPHAPAQAAAAAAVGGHAASDSPAAAASDAPAAAAAAAAAAQHLRYSQRVVLRAILRTSRDIAQGMCHLHANGIIHGDLKPGNVLLRGCRSDRRGFVALVSDFGLSKIARGDKPLELNHWSTVTVMAPEVILGRWSKASDVFSYGILLWQLVTGDVMPYGKCTVQQILVGVSQGTLTPTWPPSAHPALVRLGRACLATNPEKRPSFEAIVKILTKIEQNVRNELKLQRAAERQRAAGLQIASVVGSGAGGTAAAAPGRGLGSKTHQHPSLIGGSNSNTSSTITANGSTVTLGSSNMTSSDGGGGAAANGSGNRTNDHNDNEHNRNCVSGEMTRGSAQAQPPHRLMGLVALEQQPQHRSQQQQAGGRDVPFIALAQNGCGNGNGGGPADADAARGSREGVSEISDSDGDGGYDHVGDDGGGFGDEYDTDVIAAAGVDRVLGPLGEDEEEEGEGRLGVASNAKLLKFARLHSA
ncbi:hypothetical protein Agub_g14226, partial [Astrephomene gubernaculifera]